MQETTIAGCIDVVREYVGLDLTREQLIEIADMNPELFDDIDKYQCWGDTMDRESIIDQNALKIIGRSWPLNMDSDEYTSQFYTDFFTKARELGYKLLPSV